MIERISASLDSYPQLRPEMDRQARDRAQQRLQRSAEAVQEEQRRKTNATLSLEAEESRQADQRSEDDDGKVVLFQQESATLENQQPGENVQAEEVMPALEASVLPRDLRLAYAVQLYNRASRLGTERKTLGTMLDAVA